jgi:hypothetical protein
VVSPHPIYPLIDIDVMPLQYSLDYTLIVKGDVSPVPIIMHPFQPRVEEVVIPVQSLVDPTLLLEGDASFNHVVIIFYSTPSEKERVLLSSSTLPPSDGDIPFDWDGLVGYPIPSPMSFQVRDIIQYIMEMITSTITLSSSNWRALGFTKLVSVIRKILTFHRSSTWEPWPPP